jgi:cytochrome c2
VAPGAGEFFGQNCAGCHTIGAGSLTGPDLKNVTGRKDRDWLITYLQNPKAVIDRGDDYALHLLAEARGVIMPKPFGMNKERAESILELIEAESKLEKSQFAGPPVSDAPFPPGDADRGRELFVGYKPFVNRGPACVTCHTACGLGKQEGGKLGPELTKAYERLGGRASLTARLWSPATPTMRPVYKDHALELDEVMCLVAYLEQEDKKGVEQSSAPPLKFFMMGLGGTILALAALSLLFGGRSGSRPALETAASARPEPTDVAFSARD